MGRPIQLGGTTGRPVPLGNGATILSTWERFAIADLTAIPAGTLTDGDVIDAAGLDVTFNRNGASFVATAADGYIELTRSGASSHAGFFTIPIPEDVDDECPIAVLVSMIQADFGGTSNLGGWIGRIQAGPAFGPSWQAGVRATDYYARTGNDTDFQLASTTGGTRPAAPLRAGCMWTPRIGVVPIAAAGAALPAADPTTGVSYGNPAQGSITQSLGLVSRVGFASFLSATSTIRVTGFACYKAVKR